jgi:hypothetical protein
MSATALAHRCACAGWRGRRRLPPSKTSEELQSALVQDHSGGNAVLGQVLPRVSGREMPVFVSHARPHGLRSCPRLPPGP